MDNKKFYINIASTKLYEQDFIHGVRPKHKVWLPTPYIRMILAHGTDAQRAAWEPLLTDYEVQVYLHRSGAVEMIGEGDDEGRKNSG